MGVVVVVGKVAGVTGEVVVAGKMVAAVMGKVAGKVVAVTGKVVAVTGKVVAVTVTGKVMVAVTGKVVVAVMGKVAGVAATPVEVATVRNTRNCFRSMLCPVRKLVSLPQCCMSGRPEY